MRIYKGGQLWYECRSPEELEGLITSLSNDLANNHYTIAQTIALVASSRALYQVTSLPASPTPNTMYYVGSSSPYHVYLYDTNGTQVDMGSSEVDLSGYQRTADRIAAISSSSTDSQYPSAKAVYSFAAPISSNASMNTLSAVAGDCVFDMQAIANGREIQQRRFFARIVDPISGSSVYGDCVTTQTYGGSGDSSVTFIEQDFSQTYNMQSQSHGISSVRFRRLGTLPNSYEREVYQNRGQITWKAWYPVEYPATNISDKIHPNFSSGTSLVWFSVSGGSMIVDINGVTPQVSATGAIPKYIFDTNVLYDIPIKRPCRACLKGLSNATNCCLITTGADTLKTSWACWDIVQGESYWGQIIVPLGY